MSKASETFQAIGDKFVAQHKQVSWGTMMGSDGIQYKGKNFAFFWEQKDRPVFRVGHQFSVKAYGLEHWEYLHPFEHKPPMRGWIVVGLQHKDKWEELTEMSLEEMKME